MKKIIALAVAGAFALPAVAADITISGEAEFVLAQEDNESDALKENANLIGITAAEEVDGISVEYYVEFGLDGKHDAADNHEAGVFVAAQSIAIGTDVATVTIGDTSGALDKFGDYSDVAPFDLGFGADGGDHNLRVDLNTGVEGLSVAASMSPEGQSKISTDDEAETAGTAADAQGLALAYAFPNGQVYYGQQDEADVTLDAYGVKYEMSGFYLALEKGKETEADGTTNSFTGAALTYTLGDIKVGYESQEEKDDDAGTKTVEETAVFIEYNLGSNVDLYVESHDERHDEDNHTYFGVEYNF